MINQAILFTQASAITPASVWLAVSKPAAAMVASPYIDGNETTVATGASHATNATTTGGRRPTCGRCFKCLGRVGAAQDGLLQGRDVIGIAGRHILASCGS
jgi:hypothetical protein